MKRILISGSTSFLGSKFIELYKEKYNILGFSKSDKTNAIDITDFGKLKVFFNKFNPDAVIHLAANVSHFATDLEGVNITGTQNIIDLSKEKNIPILFMSSESIYGGNKDNQDTISEESESRPNNEYALSKVKAEKLLKESRLPYLILRGHRFVGINKNYNKPKQFHDTLKSLTSNEEVHLDSRKLFRPSFLNHICGVFDHYIENDIDKKLIFNCVIEHTTTYYDLILDIAKKLNLDTTLIKNDGTEKSWPERSLLDISKLKNAGYPMYSYTDMLEILSKEF